jgi:hypothetical protein
MTHSISYMRILNRMGYYAYQNGLIYNHLKQEGGWDSHLARCRSFINRALDYYKPEKVTVLGSGWLLDLPLAEMIEKTEKIYLVDIVHPPEVTKQAGGLDKVVIVEQDITGGLIEMAWRTSRKGTFINKLKSLESIIIPEYIPDFDPGMVISLNLLTQLETRLIECLKKRSVISEEEFHHFRKGIQEKHIGFLMKHRSVLITDYDEVVTKKNGETTTFPSLIAELPQGKFSEEWTWDIDLKGRDYYNSRRVMKVVSVAL